MAVFGFDFGTTNSLISLVVRDRVINYLGAGDMPHPSVVCYQGEETIVGTAAKDRLSSAGLGVIGNVVRSPKTLLGRHSVSVDGVPRNPKQMVADIVRYVRADAETQAKETFDRAVVTIPVDMDGNRRRELREAFRLAGIHVHQFVHEPLAALYGHLRTQSNFRQELRRFDREYLMVFDWGGGTLDLTLCQLVDGMLLQIRNDGTSDVGGDVIDELVKNQILKRFLEKHGIVDEIPLAIGAEKKLMARAETAKIQLSSRNASTVYVPDFFESGIQDKDIEYELNRAELDDMVREKLDLGIRRIGQLLKKAGLEPADVSLCLATGGMVNMPYIQSRLQEIFGPQRLRVSDRGNTIIAEGAAWIAHDAADLVLAKNIEVHVAHDTYFPAIKAGARLPREGEERQAERISLYCVDPRDGAARIQICTPVRHGRNVQITDPRDVVGVISVKVDDKGSKLFERIELDAGIDENLILITTATSGLVSDRDSTEIHCLEFGIDVAGGLRGEEDDERAPSKKSGGKVDTAKKSEKGAVKLRSNVASREDRALVPGEYLYLVEPSYFGRTAQGGGPPERQEKELTYYRPCSWCGLRMNDPRCRCASAAYARV